MLTSIAIDRIMVAGSLTVPTASLKKPLDGSFYIQVSMRPLSG
jgi:hypothetical protein